MDEMTSVVAIAYQWPEERGGASPRLIYVKGQIHGPIHRSIYFLTSKSRFWPHQDHQLFDLRDDVRLRDFLSGFFFGGSTVIKR
jgi:hypothetical protein